MAIILQEKQIKKLVEKIAKKAVIKFLYELLSDSDSDLEIRSEFEKKLKQSVASRKAGKLKDFKDVVASLSL